MAKEGKMITSDKCEGCAQCTIDDKNKARILVKCAITGKEYVYGQKLVCGKDK